ncbi:hypothetical protein MKJ04_01960 [Pontibacter sp. E15-1]|uniref:hypothetical protein n=1 Tax=Pontibacter sp. E15-1 TaxID=2919918 RepID=UPI001F4FF578|nr:hypothetical protein [Pontibacter sp. E15-1]MCJ8163587.1 hypothetical protein [Pontibacter sp. E15-1]
MRPEDIDKLFKERLGNASPTPPAALWDRLQERMQEEGMATQDEEKVRIIPILPKKEKPAYTWMYSSLAAAVSLLLSVGVVFYNINSGTPEVSEALADKGRTLELHEKPLTPDQAPAPLAQTGTELAETVAEENKVIPQATDASTPASGMAEEVVTPAAIAKADVRKPANATTARQPRATAQPASPAPKRPENTANIVEPVAETVAKPAAALAKADANLNAQPVEITFSRAASAPVAAAEEAPSGLDKKAKLAKNIFKQMRNLASGDGVELSEIGINADQVALNTQIGKQKFSKVIKL